MRLGLLAASLGLVGCTGGRGEEDAPRRWEEVRRVSGSAERGYGASVAYVGSKLHIGEPWQGPGRVHDEDGPVLTGEDGDRTGESLLGGERLVVGRPGRTDGGAVVDLTGAVLIQGDPGEALGGAPVLHGDELVALGASGVHGASTRWTASSPLWSLVSARLDGTSPSLVAGLLSGGVAWDGGELAAPGALGRGLTACDLDGDGDEDLILSDPLSGRVQLHLIDDLASLDLDRPSHEILLEPGAGRSLACFRGGLWVGGPDQTVSGAVWWIRRPLQATVEDAELIRGPAGSRLGHAMAIATDEVAIGDPGRGEVRVLRPTR